MVNAQRVAVFVDVQNMFYSVKSMYSGKLNYDKLLKDAIGNRNLVRAIAYVVQRPDVDQDNFYDALDRFGYEVRIREAKNRVDTSTGKTIPNKGSYEVMVAIDVMTIAPKVDVIVLVTGDGNYVPLVEALRGHGVRVEVIGCKGSTSGDLTDLADKYTVISQDLIIINKSKNKNENEDNVEQPVGINIDDKIIDDDIGNKLVPL